VKKIGKWQGAELLSNVGTRYESVLYSEKSCPAHIFELGIKKKGEEAV
jgi:hypothetical protein